MRQAKTRVERLKARWRAYGSGKMTLAEKLAKLDLAKQRDAAAYIFRLWGVTVTHFFKTDILANDFLKKHDEYGVIDTYHGLVLVARMDDLGNVRSR